MVPGVTALAAIPLLSEHPSPSVALALAILAIGSLLVLAVRRDGGCAAPKPRRHHAPREQR
jgi:hypothetical protein